MTDPDLHAALLGLRTPPPDSAARGRALHRAALALDNASRLATRQEPASSSASFFVRLLRPVGAVALAVVLLGLFALARHPRASVASALSAGELLAQVEQLFPGQLNAVIDRDGALQLDLSPASSEASPADQGLLVELVRDGHRFRVLAYSGRPVRLELDGVELRFDPLLTADGGVVLSGDNFVWSSAEPRLLAGWRIEARALAPVL